ncbi:MAG: group III truncated hemoglobin [Longimicrobiales bacterium]
MPNRLRLFPQSLDHRNGSSMGPTVEELRETYPKDVVAGVVDAFYTSVRQDDLIGPVFEARIDDWGPHLDRMKLFWGTVLRAEPGFTASDRGSPPVLHRLIEELEPAHFDRWLGLFEETCRERLSPDAADHLVGRARRIARVLSSHLHTGG